MKLSHSLTLVAATAIVVVGGGAGAHASGLLDGTDIQNSTITYRDLDTGSVRSAEITNGSILGRDIRDGGITGADISEGAKQEIVDKFDAGHTGAAPASASDGLLVWPHAVNGRALDTGAQYVLVANFSVPSDDVAVRFTANNASCVAVPFAGTASCSVTDPVTYSGSTTPGTGVPLTVEFKDGASNGAQAEDVDVTLVQVG